MKVVINGILFDSEIVPILLVFDNDKEKEIFKLNRYVSAPGDSTVEERQTIIDLDLDQVDGHYMTREVYETLYPETIIFSDGKPYGVIGVDGVMKEK